ncbi:hypothetical protein JCM16303_005195 [Sporobolomyces ruberrimus]
MSSSDIEGASTRDRLLPFDQLNTSSFTSTSLLRGKIETCTSYRDNSASLKLSDKTGSISVQLRGEWAEEAIKSLNRIGKWVTLEAVAGGKDGVRLESIKDKKGKHVVGSDGRKMYKVVYEMGIQGKWGEDGKGPSFAFENTLAVPRANPENPYVGARKREEKEARGSEVSGDEHTGDDNEVEDEPARKKQKRVRRETRKEWGMKSAKTGIEYSPLSTYSDAGNLKNVNLIAIAIVKREMYQSRKDWVTELWLYDPTHIKTPLRLCFFGNQESHLPIVKDGDILIVQNINYQKDKKHLTAFGNTRNGLFLVIPSSLASTYSPSTHSTYTSQLSPPSIRCAKTSSDEFEYARDLAKWSERFEVVRNHIESGPATSDGSGTSTVEEISKILVKGGYKRRELVEIKDLESDGFFDVQGQIIKFYNRENKRNFEDNDVCQLFITDYTLNPLLIKYEDLSTVRLMGQYVLQISIYGHQAKPLLTKFNRPEEELVDQVVFLRNVRTKMNENGLLEATMWIDQKRRESSDVAFRNRQELVRTGWWQDFTRRRDVYCNSTKEEKLDDPTLTISRNLPRTTTTSGPTYDNPFSSIFDTSSLERQPMSLAIEMGMTGVYCFKGRIVDSKPFDKREWVTEYCTKCKSP